MSSTLLWLIFIHFLVFLFILISTIVIICSSISLYYCLMLTMCSCFSQVCMGVWVLAQQANRWRQHGAIYFAQEKYLFEYRRKTLLKGGPRSIDPCAWEFEYGAIYSAILGFECLNCVTSILLFSFLCNSH